MQPNFIVIMTDDQGAWARGRSMPELITPTLDELGATGREYTEFFCASPVCSPARASLLTGRMPSAHGVHDWIRGENDGAKTQGVHYLKPFSSTPELLAASGYSCAHSGKWHLGDAREPAPGFSRWFSHLYGGGPYYGASVSDNGDLRTEPGYITDAIADHANEYLKELIAGEDPFYLQVNFTAPHSPWGAEHHPERLRALYKGCQFRSIPQEEPHEWFNWDHDELAAAMRSPRDSLMGFCAALTGVDQGVEKLIATLDDMGAREDTYVIFLSDNGFSCGHHGIWGKGNGTVPLNVWEDSIRVPFFINRPGTIEPSVDPRPTAAVSLHATLLELAGVPVPKDPWRAGKSFAKSLLTDDNIDNSLDLEAAVVIYDEYGGTRMIRTEHYKYVYRHDGPDELYDLKADPQETCCLIEDVNHAVVLSQLHQRLVDWFNDHSQMIYEGFTRPVTGHGQNSPVWVEMTDGDRYEGAVPAIQR